VRVGKIVVRKGIAHSEVRSAVMLPRSHIETGKAEVRKITLHQLNSVRLVAFSLVPAAAIFQTRDAALHGGSGESRHAPGLRA
jgi:hypothetical protein